MDTGSLHSYISQHLVRGLKLPHIVINPFTVVIGDGSCVTGYVKCPKVLWTTNNNKFCFDLRVMELGVWEIILGVDWMTHYSPITFGFHQLHIIVHSGVDEIVLQRCG